jgi:hypothetical protein
MRGAKFASQQMPQKMEAFVGQGIGGIENIAPAPLPKLLDAGRGHTLGLLIPETKINLDRDRDRRIEEVALPGPTSLAGERRKVIGRR